MPHPSHRSNNAEYIEPTLLIIGHRGASALRPEHTLAAYQKRLMMVQILLA